jgi:hypothetical protein
MKYKITKLSLNVKNPEPPITFSSPYVIKDMCGHDSVFFLAHSNGVGRMVGEDINLEWSNSLVNKTPFNNPSSIDYSSLSHSLYVAEQGGSMIRYININDASSKPLFDNERFKAKYFRDDRSKTKISAEGGDITWCVANINRCFRLKKFEPEILAGSGKSGYSISAPVSSRFCHPDGISKLGQLVLIADSGNHCIRGVSKDSVVQIVGGLSSPKKLISSDDRLFFISDEKVYTVSTAGKSASIYEIYQSANEVISICALDKKNIYILEIVDEQRKAEGQNQ